MTIHVVKHSGLEVRRQRSSPPDSQRMLSFRKQTFPIIWSEKCKFGALVPRPISLQHPIIFNVRLTLGSCRTEFSDFDKGSINWCISCKLSDWNKASAWVFVQIQHIFLKLRIDDNSCFRIQLEVNIGYAFINLLKYSRVSLNVISSQNQRVFQFDN